MEAKVFSIGLIFISLLTNGQSKLGNVWVTGYSGNIVNFNTGTVITKQGVYFPFKYFHFGNSNICDTNGNLVIASDGFNLYDSLGAEISGGDTLIPKDFYVYESGFSSYSQGSILLPIDSDKYYFITPTFSNAQFADCQSNNNCYFDLLLYNIVDMKANAGAGMVIQRMKPLMQNARLRKTQMMACRHGNGKDWWLLKQEGDSANVHTFLFTQDSVYDKGVQIFSEPVWGRWDLRGQSVFNSDGGLYATTSQGEGGSVGLILLADFDRCYGMLSSPRVINIPIGFFQDPSNPTAPEHTPVGLAFSPNDRFLYAATICNIYQYDLQDNSWFHVAGIDTDFTYFTKYETAYLAPDNKIYFGNYHGTSKQMSRIDNPDVKGAGCNFCPRCLRLDSLGANAYVGTPPCMPNYGLGARECYPLNTPNINLSNELEVFPNPAFTLINIKKGKGRTKELYNSVGQLIFSSTKDEIDVSSLSKGMYYLKCDGRTKKIIIE